MLTQLGFRDKGLQSEQSSDDYVENGVITVFQPELPGWDRSRPFEAVFVYVGKSRSIKTFNNNTNGRHASLKYLNNSIYCQFDMNFLDIFLAPCMMANNGYLCITPNRFRYFFSLFSRVFGTQTTSVTLMITLFSYT